MIPALINPDAFMRFSRWAAPLLGAYSLAFTAVGPFAMAAACRNALS